MNEVYFFDSYAILEILNGNSNYKKYTETFIVTTKLNLFEVHYSLIKESKDADKFLNKYYEFAIDIDKETIKEASILRFKFKKRNISMTDCIGYTLAKRLSIKFLTGDKEFEHFENVEFVK